MADRLFAYSEPRFLPVGLKDGYFQGADAREYHAHIQDLETAWRYAGIGFELVCLDARLSEEVQAYLRCLNRWVA